MYYFMLKNNINVGALIHDGLMMGKTDKIIYNDFLNICSRYIQLETGYIVHTYVYMRMYVCIYACMYVCIYAYVCMYVYMHVCVS